MKPFFLNISLFLISFSSFSQADSDFSRTASDERVPLGKFLVKSSFKLPNMTSNAFIKENTQGVGDISLGINYNFYKRFYVGLGYRYTNFQISDKKLQSTNDSLLEADIHFYGAYAELSYMFRLDESFSMEIGVKGGENNTYINSALCVNKGIKGISKKGYFYSPNLTFYLRGEESLSFNLDLNYTITNISFSPEDVCKTNFKDYNSSHYNGDYQYFGIGFGIVYSFSK